jgi:hypothetical protein
MVVRWGGGAEEGHCTLLGSDLRRNSKPDVQIKLQFLAAQVDSACHFRDAAFPQLEEQLVITCFHCI